MNLVEALETATETHYRPSRKCKVCDFLTTRTQEEQEQFRAACLRVRAGTLVKTVPLAALERAGLDVAYSTLTRHIAHVDSDAS